MNATNTSRRGFFAMAAGSALAMFPTARRPSHGNGPIPTPLDPGEDGPPKPLRILDPADPVAVELARLYDVLLSTNEHEILARRAEALHRYEEGDHPEWDEARREAHWEKGGPLVQARYEAEKPRRRAYWSLARAVITAHGGGSPWGSEWYRYGTSHRVVRIGDRIYSVGSDYDTEWPEDEDDHGSVTLNVIDV